MVSSGDVEFSVHSAVETATLTSFAVLSETSAVCSFLASSEYVYGPGALLTLKLDTYSDREVQVVEVVAERTVPLVGDFFGVGDDVEVSMSTMEPYSAVSSVSRVLGYGEKDIYNACFIFWSK